MTDYEMSQCSNSQRSIHSTTQKRSNNQPVENGCFVSSQWNNSHVSRNILFNFILPIPKISKVYRSRFFDYTPRACTKVRLITTSFWSFHLKASRHLTNKQSSNADFDSWPSSSSTIVAGNKFHAERSVQIVYRGPSMGHSGAFHRCSFGEVT